MVFVGDEMPTFKLRMTYNNDCIIDWELVSAGTTYDAVESFVVKNGVTFGANIGAVNVDVMTLDGELVSFDVVLPKKMAIARRESAKWEDWLP